jgi:hypothetical protein
MYFHSNFFVLRELKMTNELFPSKCLASQIDFPFLLRVANLNFHSIVRMEKLENCLTSMEVFFPMETFEYPTK